MNHYCYYKKQQGVSLVGAIFIMVALAAIGAAMVTLNSVTTTTSALNIEQTRAYYAAQSGMEWAIKLVTDDDLLFNDSCTTVDAVSRPISIENFRIKIYCSGCSGADCCTDTTLCAASPRVTTISVTASKGDIGDTYHVNREIQTTISYDGI